MVELNKCQPMKIHRNGNYSFSIGDTSEYTDWISDGIVTQIKMPKNVSFKPLKVAENECEFSVILADNEKMENPPQIQMAFTAYHRYCERFSREPRPWNESDSMDFMKICLERAAELSIEVDVKLVATFAKTCAGSVCPVNAIIGGITAQEVMKACSGKFLPIQQWFCFDAMECLQKEDTSLTLFKTGTRYNSQSIIFGDNFQQRLGDLKYFVIGAGAIGCELLKNFAMMGIGANAGEIIVTDMDRIEKSNLNRQFLFRPHDVNNSKSRTAAKAIKVMNRDVNITHHENRVGAESEQIYNEDFYDNLDGVANALDNVDARLFVDRKCVLYRKPLIDSGTLGTLGNVQVIVPHLTESYSSSVDPPEQSVPVCTLRHFPSAIEHTLQWARDRFEGFFTNDILDAVKFLSEDSCVNDLMIKGDSTAMESLQAIKKLLIDEKPKTFIDCVKWARHQFEEMFTNQIKQLLFNFPADQTTPSGQPFWSGAKRMPHPVMFDVTQRTHMDFIVSAANLRANIYGIQQNRDYETNTEMVKTVVVPIFEPKSGVKIPINDTELEDDNDNGDADEEKIKSLGNEIIALQKDLFNVQALIFEKDDDTNLHIDFIVAASNLRATNYKIPTANRYKSKQIAGNIIPAIATCTSIVAGFVCLEIIKLTQRFKNIKSYNNCYFNLADNIFTLSEPRPAAINTFYNNIWTIWDRFDIHRPMTLKELMDYFKKEHKLEITMLSQNVTMLYSFFMSEKKLRERENLLIDECIEHIMDEKTETHVKSLVLEACCNDENDLEIEVPYIRYPLK